MATEAPLEPTDKDVVTLIRGRVQTIELYEVKDTELSQLEGGSTGDIYLNLCIFVFTLGAGSINTLHTVAFTAGDTAITVHVAISVVSVILTPIFLILWISSRRSMRKVCRVIRARIQQVETVQPPRNDPNTPPGPVG